MSGSHSFQRHTSAAAGRRIHQPEQLPGNLQTPAEQRAAQERPLLDKRGHYSRIRIRIRIRVRVWIWILLK